MSKEISLWSSGSSSIVPASARTPDQIISYAQQLTNRDMRQVVQAFRNESYEMMSVFIWSKASAALKKQLEFLGMEFIGEMLGRADITESSSIETSVTMHEAISLAEDLGVLSSTEGMRLKRCLQTISHFGQLEGSEAEQEAMTPEEALDCLRTCVQAILGRPNIEVAQEFAEFRRQLESRAFKPDDPEVKKLSLSPYFFQRTTLSVLLAALKTKQGAALEHCVRNANTILPLIWFNLKEPHKWQVGQAYAELVAGGRRTAAIGLQVALLAVHGFDFVPETLRSSTYSEAAKAVLEAHEGLNNFYNEPKPMRMLAELGTAIPKPAFPVCMTAVLAVWLGNQYGCSWAAQGSAESVLQSLSHSQWEYYLNECLPADRTILEKIAWYAKPQERWHGLVSQFNLVQRLLKQRDSQAVVKAGWEGNADAASRLGKQMLKALGYKYPTR